VDVELGPGDDLESVWKKHQDRLVVGVKGSVGPVRIGGEFAMHKGFPANIAFVGVTEDAKVGPFDYTKKAGTHPIDTIEVHRAKVKAAKDSFAWRQLAPMQRLILNDFGFENHEAHGSHVSGLHFSKGFAAMTLKGFKPSDNWWANEHELLYGKGGGELQILDCEGKNGQRSLVHWRPHGAGTYSKGSFDATPKPRGPVLIDGIKSQGFGWGFGGHNIDGGALLSLWMGLEQPVIVRNVEIAECRTGGIMVGQGAANTNPYLTEDGYSFSDVYMENVSCHVNGKVGSDPRHAVSCSSIRNLLFGPGNEYHSENRFDLVLDARFSLQQGSKPIGDAQAVSRDALPKVGGIAHYVKALDEYLLYTPEEIKELLLG